MPGPVKSTPGIFTTATGIINTFVNDTIGCITGKVCHLAHHKQCSTIISWDVETAAHWLLPRELAKHAMSEDTQDVNQVQHLQDLKYFCPN
uniref:Uncharacterized protein n=1 Tax=Apteryx owenii TaxID=8824 RepID=A0A8B9Q7N3_APTOW